MNYEIVKLRELSGEKASVYSIIERDDDITLFEKFVTDHQAEFKNEIDEILVKLHNIGNKYGAREQWFKLKEGKPGDLVMALYDEPGKKLRVYGIRYGSALIIIGGGGPKNVRALQEDEVLREANELMRKVSDDILERTREGEIWFSDDEMDLVGDLIFNDDR